MASKPVKPAKKPAKPAGKAPAKQAYTSSPHFPPKPIEPSAIRTQRRIIGLVSR